MRRLTTILCCQQQKDVALIKGGQIAEVLIAGVSKSFSALLSKAITRQSKRLFQAIQGQFVFLLFTKEVSTVNDAMGQDVCHKLSWIHFILQLYMIGGSIYGNVHVGN